MKINYVLTFAVTLYIFVLIWNPSLFFRAINYATGLIIRLIPAFLLVILLNAIIGYLSAKGFSLAGKGGWMAAILGGALSSGPIYSWYPLLATLKKRKMFTDGHLAAFLFARAVKIPLMPVMAQFFGWYYTILFNTLLLIFSPIAGILTEKVEEVIP